MGTALVPAVLLCAVAAYQPQRVEKEEVGELRREVSELRGELRDVREEVRGLRGDQREMRRDLDEVRPRRLTSGEAAGGGGDLPAGETDEADGTEPEDGAEHPVEPVEPGQPARQEPVKIAIESNPRAAAVFLEGRRVGTTPMIIQSPPGTAELTIRIEKPGYRPRLVSVRPEEDTKLSVQLAKQ